MTLESNAKSEEKLNCGLENDIRNLANLHQSMFESLKIWILMDPFIQSRKYMSLKFTGELCVMKMKNETIFEKELLCQFKIDMRNLTNFDPSTQKAQKFAF